MVEKQHNCFCEVGSTNASKSLSRFRYRINEVLLHIPGLVGPFHSVNFTFRNRNAFAITETELNDIAAPASIGLSKNPVKG